MHIVFFRKVLMILYLIFGQGVQLRLKKQSNFTVPIHLNFWAYHDFIFYDKSYQKNAKLTFVSSTIFYFLG